MIKRKLKDNIENGTCRVYHSTSSKDLDQIIKSRKFKASLGGGAMLGQGFYANLQLFQAMKGNYGQNILMAEITNLDNFLFLEWDPFERWFGSVDGVDKENFINWQLEEKFRLKRPLNVDFSKYKTTARLACALLEQGLRTKSSVRMAGIVYRGDFDGLSLVCWYPDFYVYPIKYSLDKGESWRDLDDVDYKDKLTNESKVLKKSFNSQDEYMRSLQRARDVYDRAFQHDKSLEETVNIISSHLSRIKNENKFELRKQAFIDVCPENYKKYLEQIRFNERMDFYGLRSRSKLYSNTL